MQHDAEKKSIQTDAGQQERPFGKRRFRLDETEMGGEMRGKQSQRIKHRQTERESAEGLTVLVAGLPEGLSFGENDGDSQILKR